MPSPSSAAIAAARGPPIATAIGGGDSGRSKSARPRAQVLALVGLVAARPEEADDLERLAEELVALGDRGPARPTMCSLSCSPAPTPSVKRPSREQRDGRRSLGHDRRVVADRRAGDAGRELDALGARGDRAEHRPGEGGVAVVVEPGVEVVADLDEVEPGLLGGDGLADQLLGRIALGEELVTDPHLRSPVYPIDVARSRSNRESAEPSRLVGQVGEQPGHAARGVDRALQVGPRALLEDRLDVPSSRSQPSSPATSAALSQRPARRARGPAPARRRGRAAGRRARGGSPGSSTRRAPRGRGCRAWPRSASIRARQWISAAIAAGRRRSNCASAARTSIVPRPGCMPHVPPDVGVVVQARRRGRPRRVTRAEMAEVVELRRHRRARVAAEDHGPRAGEARVLAEPEGRVGGERVDQRDVGADAVVGADRGLVVGHADVDVLAADRGPQQSLKGVGDQPVARQLLDVGAARGGGRMDPGAHQPRARLEQRRARAPERLGRGERVRRDVGLRLDHRLEQLARRPRRRSGRRRGRCGRGSSARCRGRRAAAPPRPRSR